MKELGEYLKEQREINGINLDEITYDKVEDEKNPEVKQLYWNIAFGLQEVDGLKPSKYMIELSEP